MNGGSGAFLARASDDRRYWVKPLNNYQGERVPITEQLVGRAGALIAAPTCEVRTLLIPGDLVGWQFRSAQSLVEGIAHGSLHVDDCVDTREFEYRALDDNRRRHCLFMALYDWCWGGDAQWLRVEGKDFRYYSHDHGWYLPPEGPGWDSANLEQAVDDTHEFPDPGTGFNLFNGQEAATNFANVSREGLIKVLASIPSSWPVTNEELESVGYFLERRAPQVAERIQRRLGGTT